VKKLHHHRHGFPFDQKAATIMAKQQKPSEKNSDSILEMKEQSLGSGECVVLPS
jgi:hypothetical protein